MSKPVLVTGGTGLVGNNVVRRLLEAGQTVRVLVRSGVDERVFGGLDVEQCRGDIRDPDSVQRALAGTAAVVHAAGYVHIGWRHAELYQAINVDGSRHVAEAARQAGVRMIHVSSCDAIGVRSVDNPADETVEPAAPLKLPYPRTKRESELVVLELVRQGLDAVIVNPGFMLGPWDWKPSSGRMLLEVAKGKGWFAPRGHFSVCDVRDVADGIIAALDHGRVGERYILAGETMSYLDAWRLFAEVTSARGPLCRAGPVLQFLAGRVGDFIGRMTGREPDVNSGAIALAALPKSYTSAKARVELGYATRPFRVTVFDAWEWFRQHGYAR